jgi:hypothetical protein
VRDITARLHAAQVNHRELVQLLLHSLHNAQFTSPTRIDFPNMTEPTLSVHYTNSGKISRIEADLDAASVGLLAEEVERLLLAPTNRRVSRRVIFADLPVVGWWRAGGIVLREAPEEAPRPPQILADHPLILEVEFDATDDFFFNALRSDQVSHEYALVLSIFLPSLHLARRVSAFHWGLVPPGSDGFGGTQSVPQWIQEYYEIPGFERFADTLTPKATLPDLPSEPDSAFYGREGISIDSGFTIPSSLSTWMEKYVALNAAKKKRLLRAAYWLSHARQVRSLSSSASLVAMVQVIESLVPRPTGQERCLTCGRTTGPGSTQRFTEFVEKYGVPGGVDQASAKLLYQQRSQLTHGHKLLFADQEIGFGWTTPGDAEEQGRLRHANRLVRICAINWFTQE